MVAKEAAEGLRVPYGTYAAWVAAQQLPTESLGKMMMERMDQIRIAIQEKQRYRMEYSMVIKTVANQIWNRK